MSMTLAQVHWWGDAAARREAMAQANRIMAARLAFADGKDIKRILRSLGAD
jgi:hypothetical protein